MDNIPPALREVYIALNFIKFKGLRGVLFVFPLFFPCSMEIREHGTTIRMLYPARLVADGPRVNCEIKGIEV